MGHLNNTTPVPLEWIMLEVKNVAGQVQEPITETNPEYEMWMTHDQSLVAYVTSTLSEEVLAGVDDDLSTLELWKVLATIYSQMYGQKKRKVRVYKLMKDLYAHRQGDLSVADFYAALKSKWEDFDYHSDDIWSCPQDQMHYMTKEWENRIFLFLAGLNDEFENIRSQILNSEESFSIEDVYSRVEAEEQRRLVINGRKGDHVSQ
ncbi:hypothetical protein EJ110_NYTH58620 [Nymphaea thermarum]|nr:hypothetical protein EJ110_NYTH58620 [Nymphaea thermarum]